MAAPIDLRLADRLPCHFPKSKASADLKAHLRKQVFRGCAHPLAKDLWRLTRFIFYFFCLVLVFFKLRGAEKGSCELKDVKAYNRASPGSGSRCRRYKRRRGGNKPACSKENSEPGKHREKVRALTGACLKSGKSCRF